MTISPLDARDAMFGLFTTVWNGRASIIYDGTNSTPPTNQLWARITNTDVTSIQSSLASCVGKKGLRRFTTNGLITVEIFSPLSLGGAGYDRALNAADDVRVGFQTATLDGGIILRNGRVFGNGVVETYQKINVVFEYEYDYLG